MADCSLQPAEEEQWLLDRVQIHDWLGSCLIADGMYSGDSSVAWGGCEAEADQRFRLEFVEPGRVRIQATDAASDRCIVAPEVWTQQDVGGARVSVPIFGPCDDARAVFDAFKGTLGQAGHCLTPVLTPQGLMPVVFEPCGTASNQQFRLSGPFEHEGNALTFPMGEQPVLLTSTPLGASPTPEQIFDYRF
jgi:hypothetical protein